MALFDPKQLDALERGWQQSRTLRAQQAAANQPQPTRGRGGTLTSMISEGGALGGAAGGAALGTAILPGVGTLLGALGGGFIGGFGGRLAENKIRDNRLGLGDALKEGAISGVLGAGPLRLGKFGYQAAKGGINAARGAERTFEAVQAAKGIPIKSIESTLQGNVGAKIPTTMGMAIKPVGGVEFIQRFKPSALVAAKDIPGVTKAFMSTGSKDPLKLVIDYLASNATKGDTRKIVERFFPEGLDDYAKNSLVRNLQQASDTRSVRNILKQTDASIRGQQVGAIKPQELQIGFRGDPSGGVSLLPAKEQATKLVETTQPSKTLAEVLVEAGDKAMSGSLRGAIGGRLSKAGEGLIAKEFRLNPTQQANFKNLTGEEAVSVLRRYGVKKPEDLVAKIDPLQNAFDDVVKTIPAISQKELSAGLSKIYSPLLKSPALFEQQLGQQLKTQADELVKLAQNGNLPAERINELRKTFDAAVRYTQRGAPEYNVIKETADALRGTLQKAADKAGVKTAEGLSFKDVGLELRKLRELDDIVGKQSYLGTGSLPLNLPNLLGAGVGGAAGGIPGVVAGGVVSQAVNSTAGRRLAANTALKTGERLATKGANANPYAAGALTGRIAPVGLAGALAGTQSSDGSNMDTTAMMSNATTMPTSVQNIPELNQPDANMSTPNNPLAPENLQNSIQQILANGGSIDDATKFIGLAKALQELGGAGQKPLSAEAAKVVSNAQTGIQALQDFQGAIDADPSVLAKRSIPGRGIAGGLLGGALGTRGADAAAAQIVDVIARLRTGAAITNDEARRFETFIPQAFDPPDVREQKINYLMQQFQMVAARGVSSQPGNLEEALLSQGAF